jgi:hypothetical protein
MATEVKADFINNLKNYQEIKDCQSRNPYPGNYPKVRAK